MKRDGHNKKVVLGFSGGVDSTAAALLLRREGYEVTGLFFEVGEEKSASARSAEKIAAQMDIPLLYRNVSQDFAREIIESFCEEYLRGRTPNPCVRCNPMIKFPALLRAADDVGADSIATGHYAGVHREEGTGLYYLRRPENKKKDQTYMLYRLGQEVLSRLLLPLSRIGEKEAARDLARQAALDNAEQKDSQEICFLPEDQDYVRFLEARGFRASPGSFVDASGQVLGVHPGITRFTIGQRKGLGQTFGKPMYVTKVDHKKNTVTLGDDESLWSRIVCSRENVFVLPADQDDRTLEGVAVEAKIRSTAPAAPATLHPGPDGRVETRFVAPQRAVTPGQSIVFYRGDVVLGGGIIE